MPIKVAKGFNGILELYENKIKIKRKGLFVLLTQGVKGDKEVFIDRISSIQFKKPGLTRGYIQFTFMGGQEAKAGIFEAVNDENTIMFDRNQTEAFEEIKHMIEDRLSQPKRSTSSTGDLNNLEKLAELKEKGIITEEKFAAKKKQILGL